MELTVHDSESAPEAARLPLLEMREQYGFVPNLAGVMANAPAVLQAYWSLTRCFDLTSLSPIERQVVLLVTSVANECHYCVAAHSIGATMAGVHPAVVDGIRQEQPLADPRLECLRQLTIEVVHQRGWPSREVLDEFLAAGFSPPQVLEVLLGVTMKTLSNYTNHIVVIPLDAPFARAKWHSPLGDHVCQTE